MLGWEVLPHPLYSTNPWKIRISGWEVLPNPLYSTNPWKIRISGWEVLPNPLYSTNPWKDKNIMMGGSSTSPILSKSTKR